MCSTVMTPWCREQIPVEGNFGRLFDQLNVSIQQLSSEFSAEVEVQVRHSLACRPSDSPCWRPPQLTGAPSPTTTTTSTPQEQHQQEVLQEEENFSGAVGAALRQLHELLEQLLFLLQLLISCTFITIFTQSVTSCSAAAPPTSCSITYWLLPPSGPSATCAVT